MIPQTHVDFLWNNVINPRLGCDYAWGGSFDPDDASVGTDCSGAVSAVIEALVHGPQMQWQRQFWTGTFAGVGPGQPTLYGMVGIAGPDSAPADAAAIVAIRQMPDPTDAHMICQVQGVNIEMGGAHNDLAIGAAATDIHDREFNQWLILPGPIGNPAPPPPTGPDAVAWLIIVEARARDYNRDDTIAIISTGDQESGLNQDATDSTGHRGVFQQDGSYPNRETVQGNIAGFFDRLDAKRAAPGASPDIWLNIFWLQQRPSDPSADAAYANGRKGYLTEIQSRMPGALRCYDRLTAQPTAGDDMAAVPQQQWDDLYRKITQPVYSQSPFRALDEGPIWEPCQFWGNDDGFSHAEYVEWAASRGDQIALATLHNIAQADMAAHPDRVADIQLARAVVARVTNSDTPSPTPNPDPTPTPGPTPTPAPTGNITVKTTTLVHSIITVLGGGLAIGTWAIHAFGDTWSPGVTTAISSGLVAITGLVDFLVKESKDLPQ